MSIVSRTLLAMALLTASTHAYTAVQSLTPLGRVAETLARALGVA